MITLSLLSSKPFLKHVLQLYDLLCANKMAMHDKLSECKLKYLCAKVHLATPYGDALARHGNVQHRRIMDGMGFEAVKCNVQRD